MSGIVIKDSEVIFFIVKIDYELEFICGDFVGD